MQCPVSQPSLSCCCAPCPPSPRLSSCGCLWAQLPAPLSWGPIGTGAPGSHRRGRGSGYERRNPCGRRPCSGPGANPRGLPGGPGRSQAGIWVSGSVNRLLGRARGAPVCSRRCQARSSARSLNSPRHMGRAGSGFLGCSAAYLPRERPLRHK